MEGARYLSFTAVEAVFETSPRYLEHTPLYFRDPRIERFLRESHTDYVVRRLPSGQTYFVAGTETPVVRLMVGPAASGGMSWRFSDRDRFLTQDGQVHLAFVSRRDGRVKGVERLRLESPAALDRTSVLLDHLSDGDWVILVAGASLKNDGCKSWTSFEVNGSTTPNCQEVLETWWRCGGKGTYPLTRLSFLTPHNACGFRYHERNPVSGTSDLPSEQPRGSRREGRYRRTRIPEHPDQTAHHSMVHSVRLVTSLTKTRFPEIVGWVHVSLIATS